VLRLPLDLCERALADSLLREDLHAVRAEIHQGIQQLLVEAGLVNGDHADTNRTAAVMLACLLMSLPVAAVLEPSMRHPEVLGQVISRLLSGSAAA